MTWFYYSPGSRGTGSVGAGAREGQGRVQGSRLTPSLLLPSSSDAESDYGSNKAPRVKPNEERPPQPLPKSLARHGSLKEPLTRAVSPQWSEEPRTMLGEQSLGDGSRVSLGVEAGCKLG